MRALRIVAVVLAALAVAVAALFGLARLSDGPIALIPGGPLRAGELVAEPVADWSFARSIETIEMQLADEGTSRTTWIVVHDGAAYIPCSLGFPPGKSWHLRADRDGRAILRIEGRRYPVSLVRNRDEALQRELEQAALAKYTDVPPGDAGVWFFAVTSRAS